MSTALPRGARLPNLLVIGAMRAGTSSMWSYLRHHPQVFMSRPKELYYFTRPENYAKGLEWYSSFFRDAGDASIVGEATATYSQFPRFRDVPRRAAEVIPDARLVYLVRDPLERVRSHYQHAVSHGEEMAFVQAVTTKSRYVDASRYALQIDRWLEHYPRHQLLVLQSERMRTERPAVLREVFEFLGVDCAPELLDLPDVELHRTEGARTLPPAVRRAHRAPAVRRLLEPVPGSVRLATKAKLSRLVSVPTDRGDAVLTPDLRDDLTALLRDDVRRLRQYLPADFDGWGIA